MKHAYLKLFVFNTLLALAACSSHDENTTASTSSEPTSVKLDTIRVTGVFDKSGIAGASSFVHKYVTGVDKYGKTYKIHFNLNGREQDDEAKIERTDTIVMRGNQFVKNLTQERIASEFVKKR